MTWLTVLSPKLIRCCYANQDGTTRALHEHWCPGCNTMHQVAVEQPFPNGAQWTFDGNLDAPTFSPSVHIRLGYGDPARPVHVCHYFLRGGRIEFLPDCTHGLAGRCVPLPDVPEAERLP